MARLAAEDALLARLELRPFLDDEVRRMLFDYALNSGSLVPWNDDEAVRFAVRRLVLAERKEDRLITVGAAAGAQELDLGCVEVALPLVGVAREEVEVLVDLADSPLVVGEALGAVHARERIRRCPSMRTD